MGKKIAPGHFNSGKMAKVLAQFHFAPVLGKTNIQNNTNINYTKDPNQKYYVNVFLGKSFIILIGQDSLGISF